MVCSARMNSGARRVQHEPFDVSSARTGPSARRPRDKRNSRIFRHVSSKPGKYRTSLPSTPPAGKTKKKTRSQEILHPTSEQVHITRVPKSTNVRDPPTNVNTVTGTPRSPQDPQKPHGRWIDSPHRRRERRTRTGKEYPPQRVYIPRKAKTMERTKIETAQGRARDQR